MNPEVVGFALIAGVLAMTFLFTRQPSSVDGLDPVHQNLPRFHGIRGEKDGDGTLEIKSSVDGRLGTLVLDRGRLFEPKDDDTGAIVEPVPVDEHNEPLAGDDLAAWHKAHPRTSGQFYTVSFTPDYYLFERVFDLGCFAAYKPSGRDSGEYDDESFQAGLRYSPIRLLYGTIAPDALITEDAAGVGISFYPPARYVGPRWHHLGIEIGWMASLSGHSPDGWVAGLSFTTIP